MALSINPTIPVIAVQGISQDVGAGTATGSVALQPGALVNAEVLKVADNLVQIAIAGLTLDVLSEVPLTAGQALQLSVSQTQDGGVRLAIVGQGQGTGAGTALATITDTVSLAPNAGMNAAAITSPLAVAPRDPLTPLERMAVSVASESAATRQQSLGPLFANLTAAAASNSLPPALQRAVMQVLSQQTSLGPNLDGSDIQAAFQKSGLFLEASLASPSSLPSGGIPDLKAALIVLREALAATVKTTGAAPSSPPAASPQAGVAKPATYAAGAPQAPPLSPDMDVQHLGHDILLPQVQLSPPQQGVAGNAQILLSDALLSLETGSANTAAVLTLVQEALQEIPRATGGPTATITLPDGRSEDVTLHTLTPPPPFRGALPSAQPVANASIPQDASLATVAHRLLEDTDAALARQTLLQVASLPGQADPSQTRIDPTLPRWNFEIPFATQQGTAMAQFEISRDGGGAAEREGAKRVWRARFTLDIEPAGPVHALVSLSGQRTSVRMWAERPQTAARLRAGAAELSQALSRADLAPGDIVIREGMPPQAPLAKAGHFLDRAL
ncbi:flagellar hook-length control protein FliK [Bradyrhizobium sp. STM 3562]|uniref:flagellar hook-length control protein FliK n=1 Tax=Bradyrhizobium sp. STM 3562 TaxID=578924 RepID=UPI00388F1571